MSNATLGHVYLQDNLVIVNDTIVSPLYYHAFAY